jgi:hypothetical protein
MAISDLMRLVACPCANLRGLRYRNSWAGMQCSANGNAGSAFRRFGAGDAAREVEVRLIRGNVWLTA